MNLMGKKSGHPCGGSGAPGRKKTKTARKGIATRPCRGRLYEHPAEIVRDGEEGVKPHAGFPLATWPLSTNSVFCG